MSQVPEVDANEAKRRVDAGALLVDVREQNEYDAERIPGSLLLPMSEFQARFEELPKDRPLVMQCRSGARSGRATEFLLGQGFADVHNLAGGILTWKEQALPTEGENS